MAIKNNVLCLWSITLAMLLSALLFPMGSSAQVLPKVLHQFSFSYSNDIYFPEKIEPESGVLRFKPFAKYGYKVELNYAFEMKIGLGFELGIAQGFIPFGTRDNSWEVFNDNTILPNGFKGNPMDGPDNNRLDVFYFDFPIKLFYTFKIAPNIFLRPKAGISLKCYSNHIARTRWFNNTDNLPFSPNEVIIATLYSETDTKYQYFYPDLLAGVDFLIQPKKANHFIKIGLLLNYGFVRRFAGAYEFGNMGSQYDSRGKIYYGSNYFGISLGYHFMKYNKWEESQKPTEDKYLFNPHF